MTKKVCAISLFLCYNAKYIGQMCQKIRRNKDETK